MTQQAHGARHVGLICAIAPERTAVRRAIRENDHAARIVQSGIGRAAGFLAANTLGESDRDIAGVLSIGFCGGLDPALPAGTIVVPERINTAVEGEVFTVSSAWRDALLQRLSSQQPAGCQAYYCAASILTASEQKIRLHRETGCAAVDMESAGIAQAADRLGLPFAVVRVVLDEAGDTLPSTAEAAMREDGEINFGGLVGALSRKPKDIPALARMGRRQRSASRALANACRLLAPDFGLG